MQRSDALCRLLRSYRVEAGLTQQQLADRLGVIQTLVSKVESRERRLDVIELVSYLKPLGRSVQELLDAVEALVPEGGADTLDEAGDAHRVLISGVGLSLVRVLGLLDDALAEADRSGMGGADLVVSLQRDEAGLAEVVVDLGPFPAEQRADVASTLRAHGE